MLNTKCRSGKEVTVPVIKQCQWFAQGDHGSVPGGRPYAPYVSELRGRGEEIIPWAWGINGFFSVMGSSATVLVAIGWGFRSVLFAALTLYILSAVMFIRLKVGAGLKLVPTSPLEDLPSALPIKLFNVVRF